MPAFSTVAEVVRFNHALKFHSDMSDAEREVFIDEVLLCFGLNQVRDSFIGSEKVRGISGGQKRRVTLVRRKNVLRFISSHRIIVVFTYVRRFFCFL